ncbi:DUF1385 domain-containing protein [Sporolactobacillus spathodeae]|uniref:Uncharacterized protein YqhQ n=1 Tax=Sporolactobacillus spathodeae TaxID=1465502 RepID=A0ABS2QA87_9BACL|nr:DUF1385 domain-containing protein [Sporolactobacillus spathodeae]MBM7658697.1 uncharacterized protein YqhQ [Sporolactobacillus spathodeae]
MTKQLPIYGGQAVIEGVMMGGQFVTVTAVRRNDQSVTYYECLKNTNASLKLLKKIPLLRGIIAILEASALGSKHLQYASDVYEENPETDQEREKQRNETNSSGRIKSILGLTTVGILSFLFAKFIFDLVPALAASTLEPFIANHFGQILIEGLIKVFLLIGYILLISQTPLIKRLFQYHGAEHKVINTFESGTPLTVENVRKHSRLHYRCGSSFIVFTAIISVFLYMFFPTDPLWLRLVSRLILIPIDLGLAYELLRFTNKVRYIPFLRWLGYPGLWVQYLTTKEPSDDQIEIGIRSFERMRIRDQQLTNNGQALVNHVL